MTKAKYLLGLLPFLQLIQTDVAITQKDLERDPASNQLLNYRGVQTNYKTLTTSWGSPVDDKQNSLTAGPYGPTLLQDNTLIDELQAFARERIPERVVHAKGGGAFGYFVVTNDITRFTRASLFSKIGKKTPLFVRFSTVAGESGSADTVRDPRGFAVKFYTDEGIWDLVGNDTPIFFVRDGMVFPSFIRSQKRNPVTHLRDKDMFWDMISLKPESTHQTMFLFSDRGIPDGFRHMHGYGSHTFKLVNAQGEPIYCKFHYKTNQGIKNLPVDRAAELASSDPDYSIRDLYNAISQGNYPSWNLSIQVMTYQEAETHRWNPFDVTKVWPHGEFPLIPVGTIVLNRNPRNYFADVEQSAFAPAHFVPGIEASPDKMLQARLLAYQDTDTHRLGVNNKLLPVNSPLNAVNNQQRDGPACFGDNQDGAPNYWPNSFSTIITSPRGAIHPIMVTGDISRYNVSNHDDFTQPATFWKRVLNKAERKRLVENIANHLKGASSDIQARAWKNFNSVDPQFGSLLQVALQS